jgi:hypothetical protein
MAKKSPLFPDNKYQNKGERINKAKKKGGGLSAHMKLIQQGMKFFLLQEIETPRTFIIFWKYKK